MTQIKEKLFQIGDVAKMFHISVGSLRHYEKEGLLQPEYIDPKSNYRYYSIRQFEVLNTIRYLRALDMPLYQIADFIQNRNINKIEEKLLKQKELIKEKQKQLSMIERKIDHRLSTLYQAQHCSLNEIKIVKKESSNIVWIQDTLQLRSHLDLEYAIRKLEENQKESVVFLGKVGVGISREELLKEQFDQYSLAFLLLDEEDNFTGEIQKLSEEIGVSISFCGEHKESPQYYKRLLQYIKEHSLKICGFSREITMIDYGITNHREQFVTEIFIPIEKKSYPLKTDSSFLLKVFYLLTFHKPEDIY